jgi:GH25 family lysozyme M1 (1,4-beta-N-acetylmuramidase)
MHPRRRCPSYEIEGLEARVLLSRAIGIDVSEHNGTINWTNVKNAGTDFAFIRATYGMNSDDLNIATNATNAANAGMTIGFYHYAYYDLDGHTPQSEATNYWNAIKGYIKSNGKYLMPMLDIEEGSALGANTGVSSLSSWVKTWINTIKSNASAVGLRVVPLIYTSSSPAGTWFDDTLPRTIPLWVANYTGTTTPQTSEPTAGTGIWQDWQFWQYTSTGSVSGVSGNVDRDVLNGDEEVLKDYIVSSTAANPNGRWVQNQTLQTITGVNAYATLTDAQQQTNNFTVVASGSVGTNLSTGPSYGGSYQRWKIEFKNGVTGWIGEDFMQTAPAPAAATLSSPANNAHLTAKPSSLTWSASALATSYDVYLDGVLQANTEATSYPLGSTTVADGAHTWQARAKNSQGTATGSTFTFILDTAAPTATVPVQSPGAGVATFDFNVSYADAPAGIDGSTIGAGDVTVTGPNSFSQAASFVGYNPATGVATYRISAPGGFWNADDNGTYTVAQNAAQVKDAYGNTRTGGTIGTFVANTIAYVSAGTLVIDYGSSTSGAMSLAASGANLVVNKTAGGTGTASFPAASVTSVLVSGGAGGDTFTYNGPVGGQPVSISLAGSNNMLNVASGALAFAADVSTNSPNLSVNVSPGAILNLNSVQHLAALNVPGGKVQLGAGGTNTLVVGLLSITSGGLLDLADNAMVYKNGDLAAVRAMIAAASQGGTWSGTTGITSSAAASNASGTTSIGYGSNADLSKTSFGGVSGLTSADVLVRYAYLGDSDLSGAPTIDDFTLFLSGYQNGGSTWFKGDYDYSGVVTLDDFSLFLLGYQQQGPPL